METRHTWKGWYPVPFQPLGDALREAKVAAALDHPDTRIEAMMTPQYRTTKHAVRVMVIGKPTEGSK